MADVRSILGSLCLSMAATVSLVTPSLSGDATLRVAPEFSRNDLQGKSFDLHGLRGKVVLLNFWATWCGPCLAEIPTFAAWQDTYGSSGLKIVGISMDDDAKKVVQAYRHYHLNYPVIMGDAPLAERFGGVLGLPLTFLIDREGGIVGRYPGGTDLKHVESQIKSLLSRP